jgi:NAD(P)-dependent dehydrogenase (short-subunit alcohol dehydrogenase family)
MLEGKVVAITGAGSGIGRAAARLFAQSGARLVIGDRDKGGLAETADGITASGGDVVSLAFDVRDEDGVVAFVKSAVDTYGRLEGAFNNAGVPMAHKLVEDLSLAEWEFVNRVNATGVFLCMKHEIRAMRRTGGGAIVNTSSANGSVGQPHSVEYVASKHAVVGLTRSASTEAVLTGVRVNAVLPGVINTGMVDTKTDRPEIRAHLDAALARHTVGRFGEPEDVAYLVRFLLSDQATFINGAAIAVDGGFTAR